MNPTLLRLHEDLAFDMARIAKRFKAAKVTLIVRSPAFGDADVVLSDDDLDEAIAALRRLRERYEYHETQPQKPAPWNRVPDNRTQVCASGKCWHDPDSDYHGCPCEGTCRECHAADAQ